MAKLGNQPSVPNINGKAYKYSPLRHGRIALSGDSDTGPLTVTTTGTLIHTTTDYAHDEVYLWASNHSGANNYLLTVEVGGDGTFSDSNKTFKLTLSKETGLTQIYPGIPHNEGITIYAKTTANNVVNIYGYVDRHYRLDLTDKELGYDGGH